jgi:hypothetical protein
MLQNKHKDTYTINYIIYILTIIISIIKYTNMIKEKAAHISEGREIKISNTHLLLGQVYRGMVWGVRLENSFRDNFGINSHQRHMLP